MTRRPDDNARRKGSPKKKTPSAPSEPLKPHWNAGTRELTLGGKLVKRFRQQAENQIAILDAFQKAGWPASIPDPLPADPDVEGDHLHDTIQGLNRNQKEAHIIFGGDGTRGRVLWTIG